MAKSESLCATSGPNALGPGCGKAYSMVSDEHRTHTSIKKETNLGSTHTGNLVKTECPDSTEPEYVTCLNQIKSEADDRGYVKAETNSGLHNTFYPIDMTFSEMTCKSNQSLLRDPRNNIVNEAWADHKAQTEPRQCAGKNNVSCDTQTQQCKDPNQYCETHKADNQNGFTQKNMCLSVASRDLHHKIPSEKPHKCTQCGKNFERVSGLKQHQKIHSNEKPYKCIQCGMCFNRGSNLRQHQRIHSNEKLYACTHCRKSFNHASTLNQHLRIHSGEKPYKCVQCGMHFKNASHLKQHCRIHSGEKPYMCVQCGKCFGRASVLSDHQRIHSGEKPYKCIQCGKGFNSVSHLCQHQLIHSGEKPYQCMQCGKCFNQASNLNRHQRVHSSIQLFQGT